VDRNDGLGENSRRVVGVVATRLSEYKFDPVFIVTTPRYGAGAARLVVMSRDAGVLRRNQSREARQVGRAAGRSGELTVGGILTTN